MDTQYVSILGVDNLTVHEISILELKANGLTVTEIANTKHIAYGTVKVHFRNISYKTNARNSIHLCCYLASIGEIEIYAPN